MVWTYHTELGQQVTTARLFGVVAYSESVAGLYRFRDEMRRHLRPASVFEWISGLGEPMPAEQNGWHRMSVFGRPYRPWFFREIVGQMRHIGLSGLRLVLIDTHVASEAALVWEGVAEVFAETIVVPAASLGDGVLGAAGGLAEGGGAALSGVGEGLPELGAGIGAAAEGVGDIAQSLGEGTRSAGMLSRLSPELTLLLFVGAGVLAWRAGLFKIAPIKIGGGR
jgi:hypothetical protein